MNIRDTSLKKEGIFHRKTIFLAVVLMKNTVK